MMAGDSDPPNWQPTRPEKYLKEDPERAEAVLETIWRSLDAFTFPSRDDIFQHKPFLMDVFRAVRGERN
jgi:hypothetical protein